MIADWALGISRAFPDIGVRSSLIGRDGKRWLGVVEGRYITFSLLSSAVCGIAAATLSLAGGNGPAIAGALLFGIFGAVFFMLLKLPGKIEGGRSGKIETEMPLLLRTFGMLLDMRIPFTDALRAASEYGDAGAAFRGVVDEADKGVGVPKALARLANESSSTVVKKAVAQMISAYEHGAKGEEMRRIADDLISIQRYRMRDFVSKSSLFGLLFVIFAAVVPTLFLVFATAGKLALDFQIGKNEFLAAFLLGFPLLSGAMLLASKTQMPPNIFRKESSGSAGWIVFAFSAVLSAAAMLVLQGFAARAGVIAFSALVSAAVLWKEWAEERRLEKIEDGLPNTLLGVSGLPKNYGVEKLFERMACSGDAFSGEAEKTLRQLKANVSAERALEDLWGRNRSFMLRRMGELMLHSHLAGSSISERMHEMAEDLLKFSELRRERENALSMQKYTLLIGALVVPLILGVALSVVGGVSSFLGGANADILEAAPGAVAAYVVVYSALSSAYMADAEGRDSRATVYFIAMAFFGMASLYILSTHIG